MTPRRTLLVAERDVPVSERGQYLAALRETQLRCDAVGVHFWVFEHEHDHSRFLEFAEAKDATKLDALHLDTVRATRWHSVELS